MFLTSEQTVPPPLLVAALLANFSFHAVKLAANAHGVYWRPGNSLEPHAFVNVTSSGFVVILLFMLILSIYIYFFGY